MFIDTNKIAAIKLSISINQRLKANLYINLFLLMSHLYIYIFNLYHL